MAVPLGNGCSRGGQHLRCPEPYGEPGRRGAQMVTDRVGPAPPIGGAHSGERTGDRNTAWKTAVDVLASTRSASGRNGSEDGPQVAVVRDEQVAQGEAGRTACSGWPGLPRGLGGLVSACVGAPTEGLDGLSTAVTSRAPAASWTWCRPRWRRCGRRRNAWWPAAGTESRARPVHASRPRRLAVRRRPIRSVIDQKTIASALVARPQGSPRWSPLTAALAMHRRHPRRSDRHRRTRPNTPEHANPRKTAHSN